jgi:hypothetical protein
MFVPLRPSNEHILIVRVPGAQDQRGCPSHPPSSLVLAPGWGLIDLPLRVSNEGWLIWSVSFVWLAGMKIQPDEPERPDRLEPISKSCFRRLDALSVPLLRKERKGRSKRWRAIMAMFRRHEQ